MKPKPKTTQPPQPAGYVPLARKYRPQTFAELIGQSHVTTTLTHALEHGRIAQAYLFAGMRGVGKTSAARILAKSLNCASGRAASPCGQCPSCAQIVQGSSLDVIEIDGASNRGIDEIRTLRESVPFAPTTGRFRIYIIDEVHMLTAEAFNALLKTLEEPPAHVKFIFATTAPQKLPATILSRCQRFDFRRIEAPVLAEALARVAKAEQIRVSEQALYAIARASDGSLRDAEVVLDQLASFVEGTIEEPAVAELVGDVETDVLLAWSEAILRQRTAESLEILARQRERGKDAPQLLAGLTRHFRNLLVLRSASASSASDEACARLVDEPPERFARVKAQAEPWTVQELSMLLQGFTGTYEMVRRSPMADTLLELTVIKLSTREQWQSLDEIAKRLEHGREGPAAVPAPRAAAPVPEDLPAALSAEPARSPEPSSTAERSVEEDLLGSWPVFLQRLGAQKMSLAAYLAEARPLRLAQDTMTVGLPGFALHQEVLSLPDNRRLITALLAQLYPGVAAVLYETVQEPAPAMPSAAAPSSPGRPETPPVVQDIVNLFNATLLDRPRTA